MIDPKFFVKNTDMIRAAMLDRKAWDERTLDYMIERVLREIEDRREAVTKVQELQGEIKRISAKVHQFMQDGDTEAADAFRAKAKELGDQLESWQRYTDHDRVRSDLLEFPNFAAQDVPIGQDETANVLVKHGPHQPTRRSKALTWDGPNLPTVDDHVEVGIRMRGMDFEQTTKIIGTRFVTLSGALARLERALGQFMLDTHADHGWREVSPPLLANKEALEGTGQLPKFEHDLYRIEDEYDCLIPTAEVTLTNMVRESIVPVSELPMRLVAHTACFRKEAGSAGRDTRGMIRQHQFYKVELVTICPPDLAEQEHQFMVESAERILELLGLPYRRMLLCTGDMGFAARKTYDLEVWLPSQNTYREISSVSQCGDFQARRMDARFVVPGQKSQFVHTLNGSGLAVGRTLVAILENYQNAEGGVDLPEVLWPYMRAKSITADGRLV